MNSEAETLSTPAEGDPVIVQVDKKPKKKPQATGKRIVIVYQEAGLPKVTFRGDFVSRDILNAQQTIGYAYDEHCRQIHLKSKKLKEKELKDEPGND